MVWESTDLVHWTDQRLAKVSPDNAGNTWAPEAYWDDELDAYVVFWASKLLRRRRPDHTGSTYNKMLYATTEDFRTFSEPKIWNDPGYSVIDSTVVEHDDTYYRYTKDERDLSSGSPCSKFITGEKSTSLDRHVVRLRLGLHRARRDGPRRGADGVQVQHRGEVVPVRRRVRRPGDTSLRDHPTSTRASGRRRPTTSCPPARRHGTVIPVTQAEYDRLPRAYPAGPASVVDGR